MQFGSKLGEFGSHGQGSVVRPRAHLDPAADVVPAAPAVPDEGEPKAGTFVVGNRYGDYRKKP